MRRPKEPLAQRLFMARQQSNDLRRLAADFARDLAQFEKLFEFMRTRLDEYLRLEDEHREFLKKLVDDADAGAWPNEVQRTEPRDARLDVKKPPVPERLKKVLEHTEAMHAKRLEARRAKYHQQKERS